MASLRAPEAAASLGRSVEEVADNGGGGEQAAGDDPSGRAAFIRQRNALYARRKYARKKIEMQVMRDQCLELEAKNQQLRREQEQLKALIRQARRVVKAVDPTAFEDDGEQPAEATADSTRSASTVTAGRSSCQSAVATTSSGHSAPSQPSGSSEVKSSLSATVPSCGSEAGPQSGLLAHLSSVISNQRANVAAASMRVQQQQQQYASASAQATAKDPSTQLLALPQLLALLAASQQPHSGWASAPAAMHPADNRGRSAAVSAAGLTGLQSLQQSNGAAAPETTTTTQQLQAQDPSANPMILNALLALANQQQQEEAAASLRLAQAQRAYEAHQHQQLDHHHHQPQQQQVMTDASSAAQQQQHAARLLQSLMTGDAAAAGSSGLLSNRAPAPSLSAVTSMPSAVGASHPQHNNHNAGTQRHMMPSEQPVVGEAGRLEQVLRVLAALEQQQTLNKRGDGQS